MTDARKKRASLKERARQNRYQSKLLELQEVRMKLGSPWTAEEIIELKAGYRVIKPLLLAQKLGRTFHGMKKKAFSLGLTKNRKAVE